MEGLKNIREEDMDAFELLKQDHQKVSGLFQQMESAEGDSRQQIFMQIKQELDLHAQLEETLVYPMLRESAQTSDLTVEAYEEHAEVKELLAQLEAMPPTDTNWNMLMMDLRDSVEHHVEEEENELFVQARTVIGQQQLDELGQRLSQAKQQKKSAGAM
jgi:hemerythrin superfamily protein